VEGQPPRIVGSRTAIRLAQIVTLTGPGIIHSDHVDDAGEAVVFVFGRPAVVVENRVKGLGYESKNLRRPLGAVCGL
jgi:hypothetical protein